MSRGLKPFLCCSDKDQSEKETYGEGKYDQVHNDTLLFHFRCPFLSAKNTPCLNKGKKWRIGYYEGGPYSDYTDTMRTLVTGLIERGWITDKPPPDYHEEMPKPYLDWLIKSNSPYLTSAGKRLFRQLGRRTSKSDAPGNSAKTQTR